MHTTITLYIDIILIHLLFHMSCWISSPHQVAKIFAPQLGQHVRCDMGQKMHGPAPEQRGLRGLQGPAVTWNSWALSHLEPIEMGMGQNPGTPGEHQNSW